MKKFISVTALTLLTTLAVGSTTLYVMQNNKIAEQKFITQQEKDQISKNNTDIEIIKRDIEEKYRIMINMQDQIENNKEDVETAKRNISSSNSSIAEIRTQVGANSTMIGELNDSLVESTEASNNSLAEIRAQVGANSTMIGELNDSLEESTEASNNSIAEIRTQVGTNSTRIGELSNTFEESVDLFTEKLEGKQDKLIGGDNIQINDGVITCNAESNTFFKIKASSDYIINFERFAEILESKGVTIDLMTIDLSQGTTTSYGPLHIIIHSWDRGELYNGDLHRGDLSIDGSVDYLQIDNFYIGLHDENEGDIEGNNLFVDAIRQWGNQEWHSDYFYYFNGIISIENVTNNESQFISLSSSELAEIFVRVDE